MKKTKLVNTSDAVAYSAGVMHARALNFAAYTNRAMVADEVAVAQMVSLASWGKYLAEHGTSAQGLGCNPQTGYGSVFNQPTVDGLWAYLRVCDFLGLAAGVDGLEFFSNVVSVASSGLELAAESNKINLQYSQGTMLLAIASARRDVMQDVAAANYQGDGAIEVEDLPLRDTFMVFDSGLPIFHYYTGNERSRMRDFVKKVVSLDAFTPSREWNDQAFYPEPSCLVIGAVRYNHVDRTGGTQLIGFDKWQADDRASYYRWHLKSGGWFQPPYCGQDEQTLGTGHQVAERGSFGFATSDSWAYSGIPNFADLSEAALKDPDPRAQFAVRVLRQSKQTRTSDGRSDIKSGPRLNAYTNAAPGGVYVGLSASETYFERPDVPRNKQGELASLFNPYWQTHLMEVPDGVRAAAQALQGAVSP